MPTPTGQLVRAEDGVDLVLTRTIKAPAAEVWALVTDRTAEWIGAWTGEPGVGRTVRLRLDFEEGAPGSDVRIDACTAPTHLAVTSIDDAGVWATEFHITEADGGTELRFVQHLTEDAPAPEIGPGWEYYLDRIVAAHEGTAMPDFDDYYPAQRDHYAN